jgi:tRNA(Arg) A34 adenosine deaminase TadA
VGDERGNLMMRALELAQEALDAGDHPYGAVLMSPMGMVYERNRVVSTMDPTAHSEVMAVRTAARTWGLDKLGGSVLVTSFEPCPMCLGAILEAGISELVVGIRRTVGEAPLGDYTIEALLTMVGRPRALILTTGVRAEEAAAFYAAAG